jgi:hypothetical protein
MSLAYRPAAEPDMVLVVDSWVESYRTAHAAGLIAMEDWRDIMRAQVRKVLARPGGECWVAHKPGDDGSGADLYGWLALERGHSIPLVHYVYVKQNYRRIFGIGRGLFRAAGIDPAAEFSYTCKTAVVSDLRDKIPRARWTPLVARFAPPKPNP